MNPEIKRYLDEHGATYTPEALRKGLLDAGYEPAAVDSSLREWEAERIGNAPSPKGQRTFSRWAVGLHVAALVAMIAVVVVLRGQTAIGGALIGGVVLAVALLIGWAVSSLIGRALLPRTGPTVALIAPAISALALGGSCAALMVSLTPKPPTDGTVHLQIEAPRAFDATGAAGCYLQDQGGIQLNSQELGRLDGKSVSVYVYWYGSDPNAPKPVDTTNVSVFLNPTSETESAESFGTISSTRLQIDAAADSRSGSIQFEGLSAEPMEEPPDRTPETISGSVSWTCD